MNANDTTDRPTTDAAPESQDHGHVHGPDCDHGHDHGHHHFAPVRQVMREGPKIGRNDSCPCGSGKKYKKCCLA